MKGVGARQPGLGCRDPLPRKGRGRGGRCGQPFSRQRVLMDPGPSWLRLCPGRRWHPEGLRRASVCMSVSVCARASWGGGSGIVGRLFLGGFGAWRERERAGAPGCCFGIQQGQGKCGQCLLEISGHWWTRLRCCSGRTQRRGGVRI